MQKLVKEYLEELDKRQKKNKKVHIAVMLLAVLVVGSVAGILTQYGSAMTDKAKCGLEEHAHSDSCYEDVLICETEEGEGHTHTSECSYPEELICGLEESEGHTHTEECRFPEELVCELEESEEHQHTDDCYQIPEGYACGLEESEGHQHTDDCYQIPEGYACGLEEGEGHTHTKKCYESRLACGKEEHAHTDVCYMDAAADVEDPSVWDAQYASVTWKGIWSEDLVTAAQMQLGYQESSDNYVIASDNTHKGYTRYGHFVGSTYADWDGAFVNFCLHYAGLDESGFFPAEADSAKWCGEFVKIREENGAYLASPADEIPQAGDLIFFQREGEETANQMGIVSAYEADTAIVHVIEGNSGNAVRENLYNINESLIVSYLKISELEKSYKEPGKETDENTEITETEEPEEMPDETEEPEESEEKRTMTAEGADYTVTVSFTKEAKIPEDAVLKVTEIAPGSEAYQEYYNQSLKAMDAEEISFARYFDVTFLADGEEIEPAAPVDVKICYTDSIEIEEDAGGSAVHFSKDGTEVLDAGVDKEEHSFTFTQNSFSVVGTVVAKGIGTYFYKGGVPENLDGKTFLLETVRGEDPVFVTGAEAVSSGRKGLAGARSEQITSIENPDEASLWTFCQVDETTYHIQNAASKKYLRINGANVTLEDNAFELNVETAGDTITIRNGKYFLSADENACILAESKTESELESHHKFRLFCAGTEYTLTAEGEDYRITLNLSALEGLLDDVKFIADEITGDAAELYSEKAKEALGFEEIGFQRFFHLEFDQEIPKELIHISNVVIQYKDNAEGFDINGAGGVVSFQGDIALASGGTETAALSDEIQEEVLTPAIDGRQNTITAELSELSDIGTVFMETNGDIYYQKYVNNIEDLNGKDFLISNISGSTYLLMGAERINLQGATGLKGTGFAGGPLISCSDDMVLWHFEKQDNGTFYISQKGAQSENKYLNISSSGGDNSNISIGQAQPLTVTCSVGKIEISDQSDKKHYINSYGGGSQGGFAGWHEAGDSGNKMTLYGAQGELDLTLEIENVGADGTPVSEYITEETNPELSDQDIFDITGKDLYIDFTKEDSRPAVSEAVGTEKSYKFESARIICKTERNEEKLIDHIYFSNDAQYKLIFYKGEEYIGTYTQDQVRIQNVYRACRNASLEPVPTISTSGKISIKMIDYKGGDSPKHPPQFTGWGWTETQTGVKQGILKPYLNDNNYPSFTIAAGADTGIGEQMNKWGGSMKIFGSDYYGTDTLESYFDGASEADYLFLKDKFDNTGYYEYDSAQNGASYKNGVFTVYKQLTTVADKDSTNVSMCSKGQFLPFNTFEKNRISTAQNLYTPQAGALSEDDERYGEELYLPDEGAPNYYFGMEMATEFYQMKDGIVGDNPMRYEFSGDDDLWIYIDGVLILDMGGCHDARSGHIDFSTGEVYVEGAEPTTLYELFEDAYEYADEHGADPKIVKDLEEKKDLSNWKTVNGNQYIFNDYTKHDFKMWYMERGQGGTNLKVRFNLPLIPEGNVQVEKKLSNTEQGNYTSQKFDFQIYLQPLAEDWVPGDVEKYEEVDKSEYKLLDKALFENNRTSVTAYIAQPDGSRKIIEELPEDGIFQLSPGKKLILEGLKTNRKYFVRELNLNPDDYSGVNIDQIVKVNGKETPDTERVDIAPGTTSVDTDIREVAERVYLLINNECSDNNRNELKIKKELVSGENKGDTYDFLIWLEGSDGELKPYEGDYYLNDENTPKHTTGKDGRISGISPNDTIIIKNLLTGTKFLVEEVDPGERYEEPVYRREEETYNPVDESSAPSLADSLETDTEAKEAMGAIKSGTDAKVTVENSRLEASTWHIIKRSSSKNGPFVEALFELASKNGTGQTYYGKSSAVDGKISWYSERDCQLENQIQIKDLEAGEYILSEIETSPGYALSSVTWEIKINRRSKNIVEIADQEPVEKTIKGTGGEEDIKDYVYTFCNEPLYVLPMAGGRGIYWYLTGGILLMLAGALILYKNKRGEVFGKGR